MNIYKISDEYLPTDRVRIHYRHGCGGAVRIKQVGETELPVNCMSCEPLNWSGPHARIRRCEVLRPSTGMRCRRGVLVSEGTLDGRWVCIGHRQVPQIEFDD